MKIENIKSYGWVDAIRGMRNPLNSWDKIDSTFKFDPTDGSAIDVNLGPNDLRLIKALTTGGSPHRKFLRQISVTMDITAPVYWWAEMDTYKVGTTRNSCSVQHKGSSRDFTVDDFTLDIDDGITNLNNNEKLIAKDNLNIIITIMNAWRRKFMESNKENYNYFRIMRQLMPMGYNYKSTWTGNYETLINIYEWRYNHKLLEWHVFCDSIINNCPKFKELCVNISDT